MNQTQDNELINKTLKILSGPSPYWLAVGVLIVSILLSTVIAPHLFPSTSDASGSDGDGSPLKNDGYETRLIELEQGIQQIQTRIDSISGPRKSLEVIYSPQVELGVGDSFRILAYVADINGTPLPPEGKIILQAPILPVEIGESLPQNGELTPNDDNTQYIDVTLTNGPLVEDVDFVATMSAGDLHKTIRIRLVPAMTNNDPDGGDTDDGSSDQQGQTSGVDTDGDGVSDFFETQLGTDPNSENLSKLTTVASFYSIEEKLIVNINNELPFFIFPEERNKIISNAPRALIILPYNIGDAVIQNHDLNPEFESVFPIGEIKAVNPSDLPRLESNSFVVTPLKNQDGTPQPMPLLPVVFFEGSDEIWIIGYVSLSYISE